ncbi:hypothetical protein GCM10010232_71160 [Streptomyces amakusaensis]|uniref:Uncharacterized protein n=1 Tax=Streptomyces inusitatus TaxID=68221 RepID=A0A918V0N0_9ACTN|nr:hypothetical protein GCM10010387_50140 [Streptomyces inusitatus]
MRVLTALAAFRAIGYRGLYATPQVHLPGKRLPPRTGIPEWEPYGKGFSGLSLISRGSGRPYRFSHLPSSRAARTIRSSQRCQSVGFRFP